MQPEEMSLPMTSVLCSVAVGVVLMSPMAEDGWEQGEKELILHRHFLNRPGLTLFTELVIWLATFVHNFLFLFRSLQRNLKIKILAFKVHSTNTILCSFIFCFDRGLPTMVMLGQPVKRVS